MEHLIQIKRKIVLPVFIMIWRWELNQFANCGLLVLISAAMSRATSIRRGIKMDEPNKNPMDFFNEAAKMLDDAVKKAERQQRVLALRELKLMELDMMEAGFTMEESMVFIAALVKNNNQQQEDED